MTVGIYIRVSTDEQVQDGYSISAQRERLTAFCKAQGWEDYKFYVDEGISGRSTKRPYFQKLLKDIEKGLIKILLVYRLDRLTRSVRDLHNTLDYLDKHKCTFRSATEIYDTSTAMGRMFITIVAAIAEWESANLGERVKMGQIEKARQLEWSAQPPYGWIKDENHKLKINEEEIKAVKLMVKKIKEGYSFRQLVNYLDSSEYKPKRGYKWHIRTVMDLMHNPALYGAMRWKDEIYEGTHEGIMSLEEFERLQRIISSRQNQKKRHISSHYIYQTKIVCPYCGKRCTSERTTWNNKDGTVKINNAYRCQNCALNGVNQPFRLREIHITEMLLEYMMNVNLEKSKKKKTDDKSEDVDKMKQELKRIENEREKYQRAWAKDLITDDEFTNRMNDSRQLHEEITLKLNSLNLKKDEITNTDEIKEIAKEFSNNFASLTQEYKRLFVQSHIECIQVEKPEFKIKGESIKGIKITDINFY
ncbi:MAG: recombinase family protein [Niallia sp.]